MSMYQECSICCRMECTCGDSAFEDDFEPIEDTADCTVAQDAYATYKH